MGARASSKELAWPALHQRSLQVSFALPFPTAVCSCPC